MYAEDDAEGDTGGGGGGGAFADTVLCSYIAALGPPDPDDEDTVNKGGDYSAGLERVREALVESGSNGVCMICLDQMSPHDAVWQCGGGDEDEDEDKEEGEEGGVVRIARERGADEREDEAPGCHYLMHLQCIQSWARQSLDVAAMAHAPALERGLFPRAAAEAETSARWSCPSWWGCTSCIQCVVIQ
jgi:hypothetical protein